MLIKNVQVCGIRQAMQLEHLHSGKREVRHRYLHPLISTDFNNVGLAIKNELADTSL